MCEAQALLLALALAAITIVGAIASATANTIVGIHNMAWCFAFSWAASSTQCHAIPSWIAGTLFLCWLVVGLHWLNTFILGAPLVYVGIGGRCNEEKGRPASLPVDRAIL